MQTPILLALALVVRSLPFVDGAVDFAPEPGQRVVAAYSVYLEPVWRHGVPTSVVDWLEAVLSGCPYVAESLVVDREGKIVALVYADIPDDLDAESRKGIPELIRTAANKSLPAYSKINKVELVDVPFEKTPKMSIKRFLYK